MANAPAGFKHFPIIRGYLSLIYLYGFFSREDFQDMLGVSQSSAFAHLQYVKGLFPELDNANPSDAKFLAVERDAQVKDENRLTNAYFMQQIPDRKLLSILQIMEHVQAYSGSRYEAMAMLSDGDNEIDEKTVSRTSISRYINELVDFGYVEYDKSIRIKRLDETKHPKAVVPRPGVLVQCSDSELSDLYRFVRFCSNVTAYRAPGKFLLRSIEREYLRRGLPLPQKPMYRFVSHHNHNALDEELVFSLREMIEKRQKVRIKVGNQRDAKETEIIPIQLRLDKRMGRWYLLSMEQQPKIRRVSNVAEVHPGDCCDNAQWQLAQKQVLDWFAHSRFANVLPDSEPEEVRMRLHFDNQQQRKQFQRELRGGTILEESYGPVFYEKIHDSRELRPLLRSYSPWLEPEDLSGRAAQDIRNSLLKMKKELSGGGEL